MTGTRYWRPKKFEWPTLAGTIVAVRDTNPGGKPHYEVDIESIDHRLVHAAHGIVTVELKTKGLREAFAQARPKVGNQIMVSVKGMDMKAGDNGTVRQPTAFEVRVIDGDPYDAELSITRWTKLTMEATNA